MKKHKFIILVGCLMGIISLDSCSNGKSGGKKFNPQPEESTLTDTERQAAIEAKRASLAVILPQSLGTALS
jgi:hypothetical protein